MARIFITGSADGLGQMAAKELVRQGHQVVLHARNAARGRQALHQVPGAEKVIIADLSRMDETTNLAAEVNAIGRFDAVIHNAGVYQVPGPQIFAVNTLAPYILTCLIQKPGRLVYLSSGMHMQGRPGVEISTRDDARYSYSDSKLHVCMLALAVARKWPDGFSNAVDPGWVPTKMGGPHAPGNLEKGVDTQVWLAVSHDDKALVSGHYFHHKKETHFLPVAADIKWQDQLFSVCEQISGVRFPEDQI